MFSEELFHPTPRTLKLWDELAKQVSGDDGEAGAQHVSCAGAALTLRAQTSVCYSPSFGKRLTEQARTKHGAVRLCHVAAPADKSGSGVGLLRATVRGGVSLGVALSRTVLTVLAA